MTSISSQAWHERALRTIPGGVNSPVRAFATVGGRPDYITDAQGATVRTADGDELIDLISSWGALLLGHAHPAVVDAIIEAAKKGTSFGLPTPLEVELAELITRLVPSIEVVRMVNSGTEATASAVRVARAATERAGVIKFAGCYHGHADAFLVASGSGPATLSRPSSAGVPRSAVADTHIARFNDLDTVDAHLQEHDIAAIIVEPIAGNMGVVPPNPGFLTGLRERCDQAGTLLIFDEVMTGFRVAAGGAQQLYEVTPDLTCLGKIVGGGTPAAAYGGPAELMRLVAPEGPVYQAGTLAGNPLSVAAGIATLRYIAAHPEPYTTLEAAGADLEAGLTAKLAEQGITGCVQRVGSMLTLFFGPHSVESWNDAHRTDADRYAAFFRASRQNGVLLPPSPYETWFLTLAHTPVMNRINNALATAITQTG